MNLDKPIELKNEIIAILSRNWKWFFAVGLLSIVLGMLAIVMPFVAGLAIELLLGSILVVSGISRLIHGIKFRKGFGIEIAASLIAITLGVLMLWYPWDGLLALTVILSAFFILGGVFRIVWAIRFRVISSWIWMLVSGIVTLLLGLIIWSGLPGDAHWVLGLLLGIDMIFGGASIVAFSTALKKI